jgi:hypothetical protein
LVEQQAKRNLATPARVTFPGEVVMGNRSILAVVAAGVLVNCLSFTVMAKPVKYDSKELVGKKVCWTDAVDGTTGYVMFFPGGKNYSTDQGNCICQGNHCDCDRGTWDGQINKLPDGTFKWAKKAQAQPTIANNVQTLPT